MIRAFISTWSQVDGAIAHPILGYVDTPPANPILFTCRMFFPDADQDGLPDKLRVLVIVIGDAGETRVEELKNLAGVKMLPAYPFQKPISEIPQGAKDAIKTAIVNEGIPLSALSGVVVYGDFLKKVAKYFSAGHRGFGRLETDLSGEFG